VARSVNAGAESGLATRLGAFVTERFPFAVELVLEAFDQSGGDAARLRDALTRVVAKTPLPALGETTPGVTAEARRAQAFEELAEACEGFLRRDAIRRSLTPDERRELMRGMLLTRATDNRLKVFFGSGEVKYGAAAFRAKASGRWARRRFTRRVFVCAAATGSGTPADGRATSSVP
jgi:hypothetical protein